MTRATAQQSEREPVPPADAAPAYVDPVHVHTRTCWWDVVACRWVCLPSQRGPADQR